MGSRVTNSKWLSEMLKWAESDSAPSLTPEVELDITPQASRDLGAVLGRRAFIISYERVRMLDAELTALTRKLEAANALADAVDTYREYQGEKYERTLGSRWLNEKHAAYRGATEGT